MMNILHPIQEQFKFGSLKWIKTVDSCDSIEKIIVCLNNFKDAYLLQSTYKSSVSFDWNVKSIQLVSISDVPKKYDYSFFMNKIWLINVRRRLQSFIQNYPDRYNNQQKLGDSGVGKTNLFNRFQNKEFNTDSRPTIGVEFINKTYRLKNSKVVKCQVWDTAGQEKFRAITNAYYRGALGAFVCFDVTRSNTFQSTQRWLQEIRQYGDARIVVTLVGNKIDLAEQRTVRTDEVSQYCEQNNVGLLETSAMTGQNVEQAFEWMVEEIYKNQQIIDSKRGSALVESTKVTLDVKTQNRKSQCC
ncbi:Ras- protein Rab-11A [Paramecium bursaria]